MVLTPCQFGKGDQPKCDCGPLGEYSPGEKDDKGECRCFINAYYDEKLKQCACNPGMVEQKNAFGSYCAYIPVPPPPGPPPRENEEAKFGEVIGYAFAGALGLVFVIYAVIKIGDNIGNPAPPIVQNVIAPAAPAALVPGVIMQQNPMLGAA